MIVDVSKKVLIVGLGLLGGSYARGLKRFGFHISAITKEQSSIDYAINEGIIDEGTTELDERIMKHHHVFSIEEKIDFRVNPFAIIQ